jgi:hypothetical protein
VIFLAIPSKQWRVMICIAMKIGRTLQMPTNFGRQSMFSTVFEISVATTLMLVMLARACPETERYKGCTHHLGHPQTTCRGNPVHSEIFKKEMETVMKEAENYVPKGCGQLLPH